MLPTDSSSQCIEAFRKPLRMYTLDEIRAMPKGDFPQMGLYCWYLKSLPAWVPTDSCDRSGGFILSYVGIGPCKQPNYTPTKSLLRRRLMDHLRPRAERSSLRRSLGAILFHELNLETRLASNGKQSLGLSEPVLNTWMTSNARVVLWSYPRPWDIEKHVIRGLAPLLNIDYNHQQLFREQIIDLRAGLVNRAQLRASSIAGITGNERLSCHLKK